MLQYRLYNVLLFPEDGWLVDKFAEDIVRLQELDILRRQCIPKVLLRRDSSVFVYVFHCFYC